MEMTNGNSCPGEDMNLADPRLEVDLGGVRLKNPVIPASGCFGYGYVMSRFYDLDVLGAISFKGTTLHPRFGNPLPRVAECASGMLNSVGLQNPGIDAVLEKELPMMRSSFHGPIIANISGFSLDEYRECCRRIDGAPGVEIIELNVSCPNVHGGGMSFGTSCESVAEVVRAVKEVTSLPLFVKLSPNVTDIVSIARAAEDAGADGLCLINTLLGMRIDLRTRRPIMANGMGGFSGRDIFPVAVRMIWQVSRACSVPVIGCGGVASAEDVLEMMMAGAAANKIDVICDPEIDPISRIREEFEPKGIPVYPISAVSGQGVKELLYHVNEMLEGLGEEITVFEQEYFPEQEAAADSDSSCSVVYDPDEDEYVVEGPKIEKMLGYTNLDSEKGFSFFQKFLKDTGILTQLEDLGIQDGDTVRMYGLKFDYYK